MSERDGERLDALLGELREQPLEVREGLPATVLATARWQHAARGSLHAATELAGAAGTLVLMLLGSGRRL